MQTLDERMVKDRKTLIINNNLNLNFEMLNQFTRLKIEEKKQFSLLILTFEVASFKFYNNFNNLSRARRGTKLL